ncbi:hypothetical protein IP70_13195 [alpha proteobacterium AAP38]|nr:hypothetical protein IP70_13195 [alpha proteobacterium AAP38]
MPQPLHLLTVNLDTQPANLGLQFIAVTGLNVRRTIPSSSVMSLMAMPATWNIECGMPDRTMLTALKT